MKLEEPPWKDTFEFTKLWEGEIAIPLDIYYDPEIWHLESWFSLAPQLLI
jgi:hypothetical protein